MFAPTQQGGAGGPPPAPPGGQPPAPPDIPPELQKLINSPTQEQIIQVMRDDQVRSYRVDVETDSTIEADEQADRQGRTEFITAVGGFLEQALPIGEQLPEMVPVIGEMLLFLARGFSAGRQLEEVIESAVTQIEEKAKTALSQPPQDPPEVVVEKMRQQFETQKAQAEQATEQQRLAAEQEKAQADAAIEDDKASAEQAKGQAEFDAKQKQTDRELALKERQQKLEEDKHTLAVRQHDAEVARGSQQDNLAVAKHNQQVTNDVADRDQAAAVNDQEAMAGDQESATLAELVKQVAALSQGQEKIAAALGLN